MPIVESRQALSTLAIAIVNWNAGPSLKACLASIVAADWSPVTLTSIVVVDNASTDGSADGLADSLPLPVEVVANDQNLGFAAACNQAARRARADYILFLNPDTLLAERSITPAIALLEDASHASTGIVGIQLIDDAGAVSRTCARFPTPWTTICKTLGLDRVLPRLCPGYVMIDWDHAASREVDHVIGACYLVRASVFRAVGGFDESFFLYLEDVDFSLRARQAGWRSFYLADVRAYHKGCGTSAQVKSARLYYSLQSRLQYARKHFSRPAAMCVAFCTVFLEPAIRLLACFVGGSPTGFRETVAAYRRLWRRMGRAA